MAKKKGHSAIGHKIKHLKEEGKTQEQAVGQALGMAREGDLGEAAKREAPPEKPKKRRKKHSSRRSVRV